MSLVTITFDAADIEQHLIDLEWFATRKVDLAKHPDSKKYETWAQMMLEEIEDLRRKLVTSAKDPETAVAVLREISGEESGIPLFETGPTIAAEFLKRHCSVVSK